MHAKLEKATSNCYYRVIFRDDSRYLLRFNKDQKKNVPGSYSVTALMRNGVPFDTSGTITINRPDITIVPVDKDDNEIGITNYNYSNLLRKEPI